MLVKGLFTQLSGSVGGVTGSHNRGGLYLRSRSIPVDPSSVLQQAVRAATATLAARWRDVLTEAQRDAWRTYAANTPLLSPLGDARDVGGLPMYVRGNVVRIQIGEAPADDPAVSGLPTLSAPTSATISAATGVMNLGLAADPWVDLDDTFLAVYASRQLSQGVTFWKGPYRLIGDVEGNSTTPPTAFTGSYSAAFGAAAVDDQVRVQMRVVDAFGRLSAPVRFPIIVTT